MNLLKIFTAYFEENKLLISCLLILFIFSLRLFVGEGNPTYFSVIGNQFVTDEPDETDYAVNAGFGYDGQFFYAIAQSPAVFSNELNGVKLDHPAYRHQRIMYPLLAYALAFGHVSLVPYSMILVNMLAFIGIVLLFQKFIHNFRVNRWYGLFPLLICGLWMSLSRNLAENVEGVFFLTALLFFYGKELFLFSLFSLLTFLTREPSIVLLLPIAGVWGLYILFYSNLKVFYKLKATVMLVAPYLLTLFWKYFVNAAYETEELIVAGSNIAFPFNGIYQSLLFNFNSVDSVEGVVEFAVWFAFLVWFIWLSKMVIGCLKIDLKNRLFQTGLSVSWLFSILFATCFSISIFIDDWAFTRVLASSSLLGLLLLAVYLKKPISKLFIMYSLALLVLTWVRIIVRV